MYEKSVTAGYGPHVLRETPLPRRRFGFLAKKPAYCRFGTPSTVARAPYAGAKVNRLRATGSLA